MKQQRQDDYHRLGTIDDNEQPILAGARVVLKRTQLLASHHITEKTHSRSLPNRNSPAMMTPSHKIIPSDIVPNRRKEFSAPVDDVEVKDFGSFGDNHDIWNYIVAGGMKG